MKKIKYFFMEKFIPKRPAQASCTWGKKHCVERRWDRTLCVRATSRAISLFNIQNNKYSMLMKSWFKLIKNCFFHFIRGTKQIQHHQIGFTKLTFPQYMPSFPCHFASFTPFTFLFSTKDANCFNQGIFTPFSQILLFSFLSSFFLFCSPSYMTILPLANLASIISTVNTRFTTGEFTPFLRRYKIPCW